MSTSIPPQTTAAAAASTTQTGPGKGPVKLVQGEGTPSVVVQSQLATSTVAGEGATRSNLTQVIGDLGAAHTAHSGWLEAETQKITEWGNREIERLLSQTKGVEERLIADARAKQLAMEEAHKVELAKLVQELDARKAMQLKELEDGLQRQIQAALNTSKKDINGIESEMNKRKMELMSQAQLQTAKDVDRLSNLAVEAKLIPSVTRTVIETNTETGTVLAVAGGGSISTGSAAAQSTNQAEIQAVPVRGTVTQATDVHTGTINRNDNDRVVGTGAIVDTMTEVNQRGAGTTIQSTGTSGVSHGTSGLSTGTSGLSTGTGSTVASGRTHTDAPQPITTTHVTGSQMGQKPHIDAAYGRPLPSKVHDQTAYNKHAGDHGDHSGKTKESLLSKVKHAITGEPKSSQAHNSRV